MNPAMNRAKEAIDILQNGEFGQLMKILTSFFLAFVTITILILLVINLVKLSHTRGNPGAREQVIKDLGVNFFSLAIIGGIDLFVVMLFMFFM